MRLVELNMGTRAAASNRAPALVLPTSRNLEREGRSADRLASLLDSSTAQGPGVTPGAVSIRSNREACHSPPLGRR